MSASAQGKMLCSAKELPTIHNSLPGKYFTFQSVEDGLVWFRDEVKIIAVPSIPGGLIEVGKELASILKVFAEKYVEKWTVGPSVAVDQLWEKVFVNSGNTHLVS